MAHEPEMLVLGPLGQMPGLSTYTLLTLIFPLPDGDHSPLLATLTTAASQIVDAFPYLAGHIVVTPTSKPATESGIFKIVPYPPHSGASKFVHVKDCRELCPTYEDLVEKKAPASMLEGSVVSPAYGFANFYPEDVLKPVVIMQANLVKGGLLLTICTHHCVMDANGNEQFITQFASLCRGEALLDENIRLGNADQNTIFPSIKPGEDIHLFQNFRCASSLGAPRVKWPPAPSGDLWRTFRFTKAKIAGLKSQASTLCSSDLDIKYISSNDAVSTFIWSRIAAVRSTWLPAGSKTQIIRAVNGRKRLDPPIPSGYMGHSILCCYTTLPLEEVINADLSATTIKVRRSLLETNDNKVRSFFHILKNEKDKTTIAYGAQMNLEADVMITSFVGQKLYETSFGDILGKPTLIRRPKLPDAEDLHYMMPLTREGDIDLISGLTEREFQGLQNDVKWREFVEFIG